MENIIPRKSRPEETDNLEKGKQHPLAWGLKRPLVDSVDRPVPTAVAGPVTQLCRMFAENIIGLQRSPECPERGEIINIITHHRTNCFEIPATMLKRFGDDM